MKSCYYLHEKSFEWATLEQIEQALHEISLMMVSKWESESFYKNSLFLETRNAHLRTTLSMILFDRLRDKQFALSVVPNLLRRFSESIGPFNNIEEFQRAQNSYDRYAFLGAYFNPKHEDDISLFNDFDRKRREWLQKKVCNRTVRECANLLFRKIIVTDESIGQWQHLPKKVTKQILDQLVELDDYVLANWTIGTQFSEHDITTHTRLNITDESQSVHNDARLSQARYFNIPEIGGRYCYLHIKLGDYRIHFYPDESTKIIYVPYIGPHLPTAKNK